MLGVEAGAPEREFGVGSVIRNHGNIPQDVLQRLAVAKIEVQKLFGSFEERIPLIEVGRYGGICVGLPDGFQDVASRLVATAQVEPRIIGAASHAAVLKHVEEGV